MDHYLNLRKIAEKSCPKGVTKSTFYNRIIQAFNGNPVALTEKEIVSIQKAIRENAEACRQYLHDLVKTKEVAK